MFLLEQLVNYRYNFGPNSLRTEFNIEKGRAYINCTLVLLKFSPSFDFFILNFWDYFLTAAAYIFFERKMKKSTYIRIARHVRISISVYIFKDSILVLYTGDCYVMRVYWRIKTTFYYLFQKYYLRKLTMVLSCRFYGNRFPEVEDVVMVNVRSIAEMGAYVYLLEYNNIEGMILLSELSRRRIRSINKLIRVGRNECVVVIRVDKDKGAYH